MNPAPASGEIVQEMSMHAQAERIFEALTNPEQLVQWWGIEGRFQATHLERDLRPGGKWVMRGTAMGGRPFEIKGEYREIDRPRLLVTSWVADWHEQDAPTIVRWDLEETNGVTHVRLTHSGLTNDTLRSNYRGWPQLLNLLREYAEAKS